MTPFNLCDPPAAGIAGTSTRQYVLLMTATCASICFMQLSLHQPGDVVRMMDRGFAVQPGLRTLFELHYSEVASLRNMI